MRRIITLISFFLAVAGAINWLVVALTRFDFIRWKVGRSLPGRLAFGLVGAAGLTQLSEFAWSTWRGRSYPVFSERVLPQPE